MNTILISYDLRAPNRDYATLWDHLKSYAWARPLESVWLVRTTLNPQEVFDAAVKYVDQNDKMFVVDITGKNSVWINLPNDVSEWIKSNWK